MNNCKCGCKQIVPITAYNKYQEYQPLYLFGHKKQKTKEIIKYYCKCGCKQLTLYNSKYIKGHKPIRIKKEKLPIKKICKLIYCKCGCGNFVPEKIFKCGAIRINWYIKGHRKLRTYLKNCEACNKQFLSYRQNAKFCNNKCFFASLRENYKKILLIYSINKTLKQMSEESKLSYSIIQSALKYYKLKYKPAIRNDIIYKQNHPDNIKNRKITRGFYFYSPSGYWKKRKDLTKYPKNYNLVYCEACNKQFFTKNKLEKEYGYNGCSKECRSKLASLCGQIGLEACLTLPNKPETLIINLLNTFNLPFKYCGDGTKWVARKNPDFIRIDGIKKQVIELFGDYWHSEKVTGELEQIHECKRKRHFKKYGYECLVIWENELNNFKDIYYKIKNFTSEANN